MNCQCREQQHQQQRITDSASVNINHPPVRVSGCRAAACAAEFLTLHLLPRERAEEQTGGSEHVERVEETLRTEADCGLVLNQLIVTTLTATTCVFCEGKSQTSK